MDYPFISIIIPVKNLNPYLEECIAHCQRLDYPDYEIMVLPDSSLSRDWEDVKVVPTRPVAPSEKRDKGVEKAKGEVLAFLDDDAFPKLLCDCPIFSPSFSPLDWQVARSFSSLVPLSGYFSSL